jgi:hypothetical protein
VPCVVAQWRAKTARQAASLSLDVALMLERPAGPARAAQTRALLARFGTALNLDAAKMEDLLGTVQSEMAALLESMNLAPAQRAEAEPDSGLPNVLLLATMDGGGDQPAGAYPSGKPFNAAEMLLAGVQDVTQMRASGQGKVNDVIQAVLETLYRSMGFRFATVCLRDTRTGQYRARLSFGADDARLQAGFTFPAASTRELFHLAMENDADLMIADATSTKIRDLLPAWHRALLPDAASFIVLPLVVGKVQLGLFYADRKLPAPEGVAPDETALIKALKGQVLVALAPG